MSFLLYKEEPKSKTWKKVKPPAEFASREDEVKLVAVLRKIAESKWCPDRLVGEDFFWEADRRELLQAMNLGCDHHLVINLKPGKDISLYEIVWVMGASHQEWTPLLFRLEGLLSGDLPSTVSSDIKQKIKQRKRLNKQEKEVLKDVLNDFLKEIKPKYTENSEKHATSSGQFAKEIIHETLYLQGGYASFEKTTKEKNWNWGKSGNVNGTLLWPRVARRFAQEMLAATDHLK